jgi:excinuclease ABC subunit A
VGADRPAALPICGRPIAGQSAEQIVDQVMALPEGTRFMVSRRSCAAARASTASSSRSCARGLHAREGRRRAAPARGGDRARQEVQARHLGRRRPARDAPDLRKRLADSVETAVALAEGHRRDRDVVDGEARSEVTYSERFACPDCGVSMPELEPRIFSFNSPHGACPRCTGLGSQMEIDPDLVVPDPSLSIGEGAILPWSALVGYYEQIIQAIADRYEIDLDTPWEDLPEEQQDLFLYGTNGDRSTSPTATGWAAALVHDSLRGDHRPNLERRYRETDSDWSREKIEEYMSLRPCPECKGARLRPESLAIARRILKEIASGCASSTTSASAT